jgi:hypothetical protein
MEADGSEAVRTTVALLLLATLAVPAAAAPPDPGTAQADELAPFSDWVKRQRMPAPGSDGARYACCSLADCRVVGPGAWLPVPPELVLHDHDPDQPPFAVACWSGSRYARKVSAGFYCFSAGQTY